MPYTYHLSDVADDTIRQKIVEPLFAFNMRQTGQGPSCPLVVALKNAEGNTVGGLWGSTGFSWLFVGLLAVPEVARGAGAGSALMQLAEQEALKRGCHSAWLTTFEFQARPFYERLGYTCFGELADFPPGFKRYFMQKKLRF